jgi:hypothetical protein
MQRSQKHRTPESAIKSAQEGQATLVAVASHPAASPTVSDDMSCNE